MTKEKEFNHLKSYLLMGAGSCLILVKFIDDIEQWTTMDILRVGVGATMIAYGIFKLTKKK